MKLDLTWGASSLTRYHSKTLNCGLQSVTIFQDKCMREPGWGGVSRGCCEVDMIMNRARGDIFASVRVLDETVLLSSFSEFL